MVATDTTLNGTGEPTRRTGATEGAGRPAPPTSTHERETELLTDLRAVTQAVTAVGGASGAEAIASAALDAVREAFGAAYGCYWVRRGDAVYPAVESGAVAEAFRQATLDASFAEGVGLAGRAWARRELIFVPDIAEVTDCSRAPAARAVGVTSAAAFPIIVDGEVRATMDFVWTTVIDPSAERLEVLRTVGRMVSNAVAQSSTAEAAAEVAADNAAVTEVLLRLDGADTVADAAGEALRAVRDAFGWAYGSFWAHHPDDDLLHFRSTPGDVSPEFRTVTETATFAEGVGLSGRAWRRKELVFVEDLAEVTDCVRAPAARRAGVKSGICFPIFDGGTLLGTMDFFATETLQPSQTRLDALRSIGRLVGQAMARLNTNERQRLEAEEFQAKVERLLVVVQQACDGDLSSSVELGGDDAMGPVGAGFNRLIGDFRASMLSIGENASSLAGASEELTATSAQLLETASSSFQQASESSTALEEVSSRISTVAASAEEMRLSISQIAANATEASKVATDAVDMASATNATIATLGESSAEIGKVIQVITSIAQQTNLLALNATIEAARAGTAGKGFAVVANEVKELAKQTARATEDISAKIEAIQGSTSAAVEAIGQISAIIERINELQASIASAVEEQTATTNEIVQNVSQVADGTSFVAQGSSTAVKVAEGTREGAEQTRAAAEELSRLAAGLTQLITRFTL